MSVNTITIRTCDRCGKEIRNDHCSILLGRRLKVKTFFWKGFIDINKYNYDLCDDCYFGLKDFMRKKK